MKGASKRLVAAGAILNDGARGLRLEITFWMVVDKGGHHT